MAAPDPSISLKKEHSRSKLPSSLWRNVLLETLPVHPSSGISSWAAVLILRVPKEFLPWPPEVDLDGWVGGLEGGIREDIAVLEDRPAGRAAVLSTLGGHHAGLILHWLPHDHLAGLEDDRGVPEDEVDGARDGAGAVELAVGVGVEGVLVPANEPFSIYRHRGGLKSAGPVDEIQTSGDHHFGGVLSQENNVVHLTRNTHDFFVHAGLDEDYNLAGVFGRDGGQSAVDGLKFPTSVLGNHNVGSNGVRGSTDFQGLKEVGELSDHSQGVAGELHGGFKEVLHFLAGIAGGVLEGIQAGLFESDGGAEPNPEDVTLFGVDVLRGSWGPCPPSSEAPNGKRLFSHSSLKSVDWQSDFTDCCRCSDFPIASAMLSSENAALITSCVLILLTALPSGFFSTQVSLFVSPAAHDPADPDPDSAPLLGHDSAPEPADSLPDSVAATTKARKRMEGSSYALTGNKLLLSVQATDRRLLLVQSTNGRRSSPLRLPHTPSPPPFTTSSAVESRVYKRPPQFTTLITSHAVVAAVHHFVCRRVLRFLRSRDVPYPAA
nr:Os04g0641250 [Ipomoea batatas]